MTTLEFEMFPKIQRLERAHAVITEKIDGTNGCIAFDDDGNMTVQSRKRIIRPDALDGKGSDNYGFAYWAYKQEKKLWQHFGPGRHYGEWFGAGIQRGYGITERWFAPFNTGLHTRESVHDNGVEGLTYTPVLWEGPLMVAVPAVKAAMNSLAYRGSEIEVARGWTSEGVMLWSPAIGYLKVPFDGSEAFENLIGSEA